MKRIAVIGSLNVDYVVNVFTQPKIGETVLSRGLSIIPGGKGANQAFALGRMGANVAMFGAVGNDANSEIELESLKSANVDVNSIEVYNTNTGVAFITVNSDGDNAIIVTQGANAMVDRAYIDHVMPKLLEYDIAIFQLEIPLDTVAYAASLLKKQGKTVILDPAPAPGPLSDVLMRNVDFIKPNEAELMTLTNEEARQAAYGKLLDQGVKCILASEGEHGVTICTRDGSWHVPAKKVTAVDTTAAGDSFTAAFAYALSRDKSVDWAIHFATEIASIVVQRFGAQSSIPEHSEIISVWNDLEKGMKE